MATSKDPRDENLFGERAIRRGALTPDRLKAALAEQARQEASERRRIGEILVQRGALTTEQVKEIVREQKSTRTGTLKRRIGDFELRSKLGEGGMGTVYRARQISIDRDVALKILPQDLAKDPDFRERFLREARAVAKLNHPNIVTGIDVGEIDGVYYFAMEYVDGPSLGDRLKKSGNLPEDEALEYTRQIALALQHAHANGFLHRDVKPDNILVNSTGVAKLADLGLCRTNQRERPLARGEEEDPDDDSEAGLTRKGKVVGTPHYISPEQAKGQADLSPAADLYSLGATLFFLLTGQTPYRASTGKAVMLKHLRDPVPDPRQLNSDLSAEAAGLCMRLMEKEPKDRLPSGNALAGEIQKLLAKRGRAASSRSNPSSRKINLSETPPKGISRGKLPIPASLSGPAAPSSAQSNVRMTRILKKSEGGGEGSPLPVLGAVAGILVLVAILALGGSGGGTRTRPPAKAAPEVAQASPKQPLAPVAPPAVAKPQPIPPRTPAGPVPAPAAPEGLERTMALPPLPQPDEPAVLGPVPPPSRPQPPGPPSGKTSDPAVRSPEPGLQNPERQAQLLKDLQRGLAKDDFAGATKLLDAFAAGGGLREDLEFARNALQTMKEFDSLWREKRSACKGKDVKVGNFSGKLGEITSEGFSLTPPKSQVGLPFKWADVPAGDRLLMLALDPEDSETLARQGLYRYLHGEPIPGARMLLRAEKAGKTKLPETWRVELESLQKQGLEQEMAAEFKKLEELEQVRSWLRLAGGVRLFREKYGEAGAAYDPRLTEMTAKAEVVKLTPDKSKPAPADPPPGDAVPPMPPEETEKGPSNVPVPESPKAEEEKKVTPEVPAGPPPTSQEVAHLFKVQSHAMSGVVGHLRLVYDFKDEVQMADFEAASAGKWALSAKGGLELKSSDPKRRANRIMLVHNAKWLEGSFLRVQAEVQILKESDALGVGMVDEPLEGASRFLFAHVGGRTHPETELNTVGAQLLISGLKGDRGPRDDFSYKENEVYRLSLTRDGTFVFPKVGDFKQGRFRDRIVGKLPQKDLKERWGGYAVFYSHHTPLVLRNLEITGQLDTDWLREQIAKLRGGQK